MYAAYLPLDDLNPTFIGVLWSLELLIGNHFDGFPHFRPGTIDVRARAYDFYVRFLSLGCFSLCVLYNFLISRMSHSVDHAV
jgi:hypothetical protein